MRIESLSDVAASQNVIRREAPSPIDSRSDRGRLLQRQDSVSSSRPASIQRQNSIH